MRNIRMLAAAVVVIGCSRTSSEFNPTGAPTVEFSVPDMMCEESCAAKTKEILSEMPGAKEVVVDFDTKTATVAIEEGAFDANAAIAALVDHGFGHSAVKGGVATGDATDTANDPATATPQAAPSVQ